MASATVRRSINSPDDPLLKRRVLMIQTRYRLDRRSPWREWEDLTPDTRYNIDEVRAFHADLDESDHIHTEWRAVLLPEHGAFVLDLRPLPRNSTRGYPPLCLSREMPESVHRLNDAILTMMGV